MHEDYYCTANLVLVLKQKVTNQDNSRFLLKLGLYIGQVIFLFLSRSPKRDCFRWGNFKNITLIFLIDYFLLADLHLWVHGKYRG